MKKGRPLSITAEELLSIGKYGTKELDRIGGLKINTSKEKFSTPKDEKFRRRQIALGIIYTFASKVIEDNTSDLEEQKEYWRKFIKVIKLVRHL